MFQSKLSTLGWIAILMGVVWQTQAEEGIATIYGSSLEGMNPNAPSYGTLDGACGWGALSKGTWPYWKVAGIAVGSKYYNSGPSKGCGQCFEICCSSRNGPGACKKNRCMTVVITDHCPQCISVNNAEFDVQAATMYTIVNNANDIGRVKIDYKPVACNPPGGITFNIKNNNGPGNWLKISVQNVAGAGQVKAVHIAGPDGRYQNMMHTYGGVFEAGSSPRGTPWTLHVIAANNQAVTCRNALRGSGTGLFKTNCRMGGGAVSVDSKGKAKVVGKKKTAKPVIKKVVVRKRKPGCNNVSPGGPFNCAQQKGWGKCNAGWMKRPSSKARYGFCALTCGRC